MINGDSSDFTPGEGMVTEGVREGILVALARDDLEPEDRAQLEAALKNLDAEAAPETEAPTPPDPSTPKIIDPSAAPPIDESTPKIIDPS